MGGDGSFDVEIVRLVSKDRVSNSVYGGRRLLICMLGRYRKVSESNTRPKNTWIELNG